MTPRLVQVDLDELDAFRDHRKRLRCRTCRLLAGEEGGLLEEDRVRLLGALQDDDTQHQMICDWLHENHGIHIDQQTVGRHRNGRCLSGAS